MPVDQTMLKLVLKVALLERVIIELIAENAALAEDPDQAVKSFSDRLHRKLAPKVESFPDEAEAQLASAMSSNEFESFFHRVLLEVRRQKD